MNMFFCQLCWNLILAHLVSVGFWITTTLQGPFFHVEQIPMPFAQCCGLSRHPPRCLARQIKLIECHIIKLGAVKICAFRMDHGLRLIIALA